MEKCPHDRNNESRFKKRFERCKRQKYLKYFYTTSIHVLPFFVVINFNYTLGTINIIFILNIFLILLYNFIFYIFNSIYFFNYLMLFNLY